MERLQLKAERGVYVVQGTSAPSGYCSVILFYWKVLLLQALSFSLLKCFYDYMITSTK